MGRWDLPTQVKNRNYPKDGIVELQEAVEKQASLAIAYADALRAGTAEFSVVEYNKYLSCLASGLVTFAPQGRSGAIEKMSFEDFMRCYNNGEMPSSTNFKTSGVYGRQVITIAGPLMEMLVYKFIHIVRPLAVIFRQSIGIRPSKKGTH